VSGETSLKSGADSELQARSPARSVQSDVRGRSDDKTIEGEQWGSDEGIPEEQSVSASCSSGEQGIEIDRGSKKRKVREQGQHNRGSGGKETDRQSGQVDSLWLKTVLPEASSGWWDVYQKDNGFAVKFRWRDRGRQTLTFPRISYQHLQALRESAPDETGRVMRDRITASLRKFLLTPDKRDKALLVAQKLGIAPDDLETFTTAN
jgi:hypothetical protein